MAKVTRSCKTYSTLWGIETLVLAKLSHGCR